MSRRAVDDVDEAQWVVTPHDGVERRILDCDGGNGGRATSIVRLPAGHRADLRGDHLGEEALVLKGTLSDDLGDYPVGTYVRNPPGSIRRSWTDEGCAALIKSGQFQPGDRQRVVVDTGDAEWFPGLVKGLAVLPLHRFGEEVVSLVRWAPGTVFPRHDHPGGEEILVLEGALEDDDDRYPTGTWLRNPPGSVHRPFSLDGCLIYVKIGHLVAPIL